MKYTIVIPAYNEEARIGLTLREYAEYIENSELQDQTELLVVVNGSRDKTAKVANDLRNEHPCIHVWEMPQKLGKGGAVLQGFDIGKGSILAFADADNATTAPELKKLIDVVEQGADAALGSRWLKESRQLVKQPFARRVASRIFNIIIRVLFQITFKDTQCGAKAFRAEAIRSIRSKLISRGWAFDVELIWLLKMNKCKIEEVPITWSDNSHSRLRMHTDAPSMLLELLKIRFRNYGTFDNQ